MPWSSPAGEGFSGGEALQGSCDLPHHSTGLGQRRDPHEGTSACACQSSHRSGAAGPAPGWAQQPKPGGTLRVALPGDLTFFNANQGPAPGYITFWVWNNIFNSLLSHHPTARAKNCPGTGAVVGGAGRGQDVCLPPRGRREVPRWDGFRCARRRSGISTVSSTRK